VNQETLSPERVERVLIYRLGSLGDTVVALPALHVVERAFPQAERRLLTNVPVHAKAPAAWALLKGSGLVQRTMNYPVGTRNPLQLARLVGEIRRFRPDLLVYLMQPRGRKGVARDLRFFRISGIKRFAGLPEGDLAQNRYDAESGVWEREAAYLLRRVQPLGEADVNDLSNWDLRLTEKEVERARAALAPLGGAPFVACGPGTKMQSKDWGGENWRELLGRLSDQLSDRALALVGAKEDFAVSTYAGAAWRGATVNLCGELTPRETAAALRGAELFLGPDSGPMHLAAAYGVPCAIAFSALDRRGRWFPVGRQHRLVYHPVECAGCLLETCVEQKKKCLTSISVEEMLEAAMAAWRGESVRGEPVRDGAVRDGALTGPRESFASEE
jgi:heptosyltransferase-3